MGKQAYIGVGNIARKIKSINVGVGGVARKVKKGYIGDASGKAREFFAAGWWMLDDISSSDVRAVWIAKGANSLAASLIDQTGNGNNLTGATPAFNSSIGWTNKVLFAAINNLAAPPYTIFWKGNWITGQNDIGQSFFGNSSNTWNGLFAHSWDDSKLYIGHNTSTDSRFSPSVANYAGVHTVVYQKYGSGDNRHSLWIDGTLNATIPGVSPSNISFKLGTGRDNCAGALIFGKILTSTQISEILNRFNSI